MGRLLIFSLVLVGIKVSAASNPSLALDRDNLVSVSITAYNSDFAVVREVRETVLPQGLIELEYLGVPKFIEPTSVISRSLGNGDKFRVLEQNYQYHLLNRATLLNTFIGRKLKYARSVLQGTKYEKVLREGILLSTNPEIVEFGDEIEISPEGVISLPYVPEGLNLSPTLVWLLSNEVSGEQLIETSYITSNLGWQADYVLVLDENKKQFDLTSWITIDNQSGTGFDDVKVQLIAGEVNRVIDSPPGAQRRMMNAVSMEMASDESRAIRTNQVFDYHVYDLPLETNIKDNEKKQIRFFNTENVNYAKSYHLTSQAYSHHKPEIENRHPDSRISFINSKKNQLGMPLPAGNNRVYLEEVSEEESGRIRHPQLQLVGEDVISHTALDQTVDLDLGKAFDISAERKQLTYRRLGDRVTEASYQIELQNSKSDPVSVHVHEKLQGDWQIIEETEAGTRTDSSTLDYLIRIPANGKSSVSYTVRMRF